MPERHNNDSVPDWLAPRTFEFHPEPVLALISHIGQQNPGQNWAAAVLNARHLDWSEYSLYWIYLIDRAAIFGKSYPIVVPLFFVHINFRCAVLPPCRAYNRMRSLPRRRVNFSRSRYSSSGMACLRVRSKSSLNSATPNLVPDANLALIWLLISFSVARW
jgi:hypothetical protein